MLRTFAIALLAAVGCLACAGGCGPTAGSQPYFGIKVVDEETHRGVPAIELKTTSNLRYYTDSNGLVAFNEPGLMDRKVYFSVAGDGYEFAKDSLGLVGVALDTHPGGTAQLTVRRTNVAQRLYRVTGEGIYRDSFLLGQAIPIRQGLLNGEVVGQDSVQTAIYNGKVYWFWGDTARVRYGLGHFQTSGATSELPQSGGLAADVGVNLTYFVDGEGFSRPMCPMSGGLLVWIDGVTVVPDETGRPRMVASYARLKELGDVREHGLVVFNDQKQVFEKTVELDLKDQVRCPHGHPISWQDGREQYLIFPGPWPTMRVKANLKDMADQARYEAFTPLLAGSTYAKGQSQLELDKDGKVVWGWKARTDGVDQAQEKELIALGKIPADQARFQLRDVATGKAVQLHGGTFNWNAYRKKWILIGPEAFGSSFLGEIWYAEADSPMGPWTWAVKIVSHRQYSFYNPVQHAFFDSPDGRTIYFEGTYTSMFSGNPYQTPLYDYNQIMYRLDLDDWRLLPLRQQNK